MQLTALRAAADAETVGRTASADSAARISRRRSPGPRINASHPHGIVAIIMADLRSKPLIVRKGLLFLVILVLSAGLLLVNDPDWRTAGLLAAVIWASARFYYFLFYVLERYVDPTFKYSGLMALFKELLSRRRQKKSQLP
jgi:hypothetical protein